LGHVYAQCNLGYCYSKGLGVEQDYGKAAEWYTAAAQYNDHVALTNLGYLYEEGLGVEKDLPKAMSLYIKAYDEAVKVLDGYKPAEEGIERLQAAGVK